MGLSAFSEGKTMSAPLFKKDILFLQRILKTSGFYNGPLDGKWNKAMDEADAKFDAESERIKASLGAFDKRTEDNIATLLPAAQSKAREFMNAVPKGNLTYRIISGTRTYDEQNALFAIGRTVEMNRKPVTKARGGQSNHNFGIAWDVGIFEDGHYYAGNTKKERQAYADLAGVVKARVPNLEWGGDWSSFPDAPHYQLQTKKSTAQVRALFQQGKPYV
jgi:peptidoglycan L-alanyl-D-glutamate endopeptidase CwlK